MIVTVFADASFCHRTKAAGYALWVKTEAVCFEHSGRFKSAVPTSSAAETLALANGLWAAIEKAGGQPGDVIVAQSDCLHAIRALDPATVKPVLSPAERDARARVLGLLRERGMTVRFKHVKGHSKTQGRRSWVNGRVDQLARAAMEDQRSRKGASLLREASPSVTTTK